MRGDEDNEFQVEPIAGLGRALANPHVQGLQAITLDSLSFLLSVLITFSCTNTFPLISCSDIERIRRHRELAQHSPFVSGFTPNVERAPVDLSAINFA